jgi:hypothetical protein
VPCLLRLTRCMAVCGPIVVASGTWNSHISSQLFPLGQVKVLLRRSIVETYECGVRNVASNCRHAWREEVIGEKSVTLLLDLLSVYYILSRMSSSCPVSDTYSGFHADIEVLDGNW